MMSFTIICDKCGSKNVTASATINQEVGIDCKDCDNCIDYSIYIGKDKSEDVK